MREAPTPVQELIQCYHCGQACSEETLTLEDKTFCCYGCKTVYEILSENNLCEYYALDANAGVQLRHVREENFAYLDETDVKKKILSFDSANFSRVTFFIPAIHCVSCIWLLEHLKKIVPGVLRSEVNFSRKQVTIDFNPEEVRLSKVAQRLMAVGYAPSINLTGKQEGTVTTKSLVIRLALAGFCFGNIMLFSFPEYLGLDNSDDNLRRLFSWLNLALSVPVLFYSAQHYFTSAWKSFQQKQINIDVPIAIGLAALFLRSAYDITTGFGPGYLDSFSGLVFFLLIGRWFQDKTYENLAFDRDFKSYFPLAVNRWIEKDWKPTLVFNLEANDTIQVRNMEIVPTDSMLLDDKAYIDYSFVTGEAKPVRVSKGERVYAGGRLLGQPVRLMVQKKTSQSHLTSLWNNDAFRKPEESRYQKRIDRAARIFTWVVMGLAVITAVYWYVNDPSQVWLILTSVLMVACPCALALAAPFTYGSMVRVFGKSGFYVKNADVIERMAVVDKVVFDKTGTLTHGASSEIKFVGALEDDELKSIKALTFSSTHPLSSLISKSIEGRVEVELTEFKEIPGKGIEGIVDGKTIRIGSSAFMNHKTSLPDGSNVFVSVDGDLRGYFSIGTRTRETIPSLVKRLGNRCAALLSGDSDGDRNQMKMLFAEETELLFNQSPHDKLHYISGLQRQQHRVMMLGDGLNDSGALKQSDVGIAVTDDTGVFTPACDGIVQGDKLGLLDKFLSLSQSATTILKIGFGISFFYNVIALSFAVTGHLTPLVAAILMPISSISVVSFSTLAVNLVSKRKLK